MKKRTVKHKNITRIDHPAKRTYGYFVRIQWNGERRSKFFSDGVYGDRLAALAAALEWRDSTEAVLGKPRTERVVVGKIRSATGGTRGAPPQGRQYRVLRGHLGHDGR